MIMKMFLQAVWAGGVLETQTYLKIEDEFADKEEWQN